MTKSAYISAQIREQILYSKELKPNQMLPTEQDLCKLYGVSKMTIKKALDPLVSEGLIYKKRGLGTFVKNLPEAPLNNIISSGRERHLLGFNQEHSHRKIGTQVLEYTIIPASEFIAERLNISTDDFVYHIIRVRSLDASPVVYEDTYMPIDIVPGLKRTHAEVSIYSYIRNELQLEIQSSHVVIKAKKCPDHIAAHLNLTEGEPIAELTQIAFLNNGQIFEYSISSHRYDKFEFHNVIIANQTT